ncbi:hypothetical protein BCR33DRAFT_717225 [Rhizoclosmatium globosum]|uniref:Transmembrane protein n=1 Tax=Rhizoclosmatium globosum TaxID=329046 RepID=A0A1Y2CAS5_9FUNG|nr:hypothetical protein BCR33DRAFT_717225 [Rhizoclosmatium globosum]|eukprot:ORY44139.1 hypothetical protein BCR33DRAFT_717225 [Rhizoclosmatium globosum]
MQNGTISSIDTTTFYLNVGLSALVSSTQHDSTRPSISIIELIFNKFNILLVAMLLVVTFQPAIFASALTISHVFNHAPKWHVILNIFGTATIETAYIFYCWIRSKGIPGLKNTALHSILSVFVKYCPILLYSQLIFALLPDSPVIIKCERWSLLISAVITAAYDVTLLHVFIRYLWTESETLSSDRQESVVGGNSAVELNALKFRVTARCGVLTSAWGLLCLFFDLISVLWVGKWVNFFNWLAWLCLHNGTVAFILMKVRIEALDRNWNLRNRPSRTRQQQSQSESGDKQSVQTSIKSNSVK